MPSTPHNDAALTGALVDLPLGDLKLRLHTLTDRDHVELDEHVRGLTMAVVMSTARVVEDKAQRDELVSTGIRTTAALTWMSRDGQRMMQSIDGMARLLWQCMDAKQRDKYTPADLKVELLKPGMIELMNVTFDRLNNSPDSDNLKKDQPELGQGQAETTST